MPAFLVNAKTEQQIQCAIMAKQVILMTNQSLASKLFKLKKEELPST